MRSSRLSSRSRRSLIALLARGDLFLALAQLGPGLLAQVVLLLLARCRRDATVQLGLARDERALALVELAPPAAVCVDGRCELKLALGLLDLCLAALHVRLARLELGEEGEGVL